jgi:hypothetical protein
LYIGGEGRSGSTVLSTILGSYEGIVSIGEFRIVWEAMKNDELCGCGEPVSRCEFWGAVFERALGNRPVDLDAMLGADARYARHRSIPSLFFGRSRVDDPRLDAYRVVLGRLYDAICVVAGCEIVVDSTKRASYAYLLRDVPGIDLRVVHLVRDSRGVAYSGAKTRIQRPEVRMASGEAYMSSQPVWRTAVDWQLKNLLFYTLVPRAKRRLVKYERLVSDPSSELAEILRLAGAEPGRRGAWDATERSFEWAPHHTLGGNPVRFRRGNVRLEPDLEWKTCMKRAQKLVVSAITFPLLVAYGYMRPRVRSSGHASTPSATGPREV